MKKTGICVIAGFVLLLTAIIPVSSDDMMFQPAAIVNLIRPTMISLQDVDDAYGEYQSAMQQQNQQITESREDMLQVLIENELLIQGSRRFGVQIDEREIQAAIQEQKQSVAQQLGQRSLTDEQFVQILDQYFGRTLDGLKQDIERQLMVERYVMNAKRNMIESISAPTEQEVRRVYREHATDFINPEFARIQHVFVSNQDKSDDDAYEKIRRAYRRLQSGEKSFSELVIEVTEDGGTRFTEGEIGWLPINDAGIRQMLGVNFVNEVFELSTGEISGIIESNAGYHIVRMVEHREARVLGLNDPINPGTSTTVYQYISSVIFQQKQAQVFNQAIEELVEELRKEADIRILM